MRTLKDIRELYTPKSADEKRFVDKHVVKKTKDANGNKDDVFNAKNVKTVKRAPEHGYDPDDDEKVYEQYDKDEMKKRLEKAAAAVDKQVSTLKTAYKNYPPNKPKKQKETQEEYVSDAQRKAVWASRNEKKKKMKEDAELDEVLKPSMGAKAYIDDFIKSKDPRFKGKSKKKRIQMALGAYYADKREDGDGNGDGGGE